MQPMAPPQAPSLSSPSQPFSTALQADPPDHLSRLEIISVAVTISLGIALAIFAFISFHNSWKVCLALSLGALGGLIHEMVQSGGKILFFERKLDGFYMGGVAGMILGAVAGLLSVHGLLDEPSMYEIGYQTFLAGLGLKGIVEAASSQPLPPGTKSLTTTQIMAANQALNTAQPSVPQNPGVLALPPPPSQIPQ